VISTVTTVTTTSTSTGVSTVTAAASLTAGCGLLVVATLVFLLVVKDLAGAASESLPAPELTLQGALDKVLTAGVIPLLIAFACIVAARIMEFM